MYKTYSKGGDCLAIVFIRTIIVYIALILSMRLMGKRQLGELELSEVVIAVLIADMASHPLQDIGIPLLNGLIPIIVLMCCEVLVSGGVLKSIKFRAFICGRPSIIIKNGMIDQEEMKRCRLCLDELTEDLRKKGFTDLSKIKYAILETDGTLNPLPYATENPPSAVALNIPAEDFSIPRCVISDGRIIERNLTESGKDMLWLKNQLKSRNINSHKEVYYMTVDDFDKIYFLAKEPVK